MSRALRARLAALFGATVAAWPTLAAACPVCFSALDSSRVAYLATTLVLSVLPLAMVGGLVWWMARRARRLEREPDLALGERPGPGAASLHGPAGEARVVAAQRK